MQTTTTLMTNLPNDDAARQSRPWLSVREAARVLREPQHRVVKLAQDRVLSGKPIDGHWWLRADSVREYARRQRRQKRTLPGSVARRIGVAGRATGTPPAQGDLFLNGSAA